MKTFFTSSLALFAMSMYLLVPATLQAQQLYTNGTFTTGTISKSGTVAPTGFTWSEAQNNTGETTISNTSAGYTASKATGYTLADNFVVPASQSWTINNMSFFGYQSGYTGTTSPFTELYVRIWRGSPAVAGSTIVYGDLTTNRYAGATSTNSYRIFNSLYPTTANAPTTTRLVWKVRATLSPAPVLPAGTYWVEWMSAVSGTLTHFFIPVTTLGLRQTAGANALQFVPTTSSWNPAIDSGNPDSAPDVTIDFPFLINDASVTATTSAAAGPQLRVGPVPTDQDVQVEFTELRGASELTMNDMQGRQVWAGKVPARSSSVTVPMARLAAGIYTLSVHSAEGINRVRVVKY